MAIGQILGGVLGGAAGLALGGNPATAAAGYSIGSGVGGLAEGMIQQKKAEGMDIMGVTPQQTQLLEDIRMRRRAMDAGTMYQPQQRSIMQTGQGAMREAVKATGGDTGATISALQKISRGTGRSLNELYGQMMNVGTQTLGLENQLVTDMANREYALSAYAQQQQMYDAMQKQKDALQIISGVVGQQLKSAGYSDDDIWKFIMENWDKISGKENTNIGQNGQLSITQLPNLLSSYSDGVKIPYKQPIIPFK